MAENMWDGGRKSAQDKDGSGNGAKPLNRENSAQNSGKSPGGKCGEGNLSEGLQAGTRRDRSGTRRPLSPPPSANERSAADFRAAACEALRGKWLRMSLVMLVFVLLTSWQIGTDAACNVDFFGGRCVLYTAVEIGPVTRIHEHTYAQLPDRIIDSRPDIDDVRAAWSGFILENWEFLAVALAAALAAGLIFPMLEQGYYEAMGAAFRGDAPRVGMLFARAKLFGRALWLRVLMALATGVWLFVPLNIFLNMIDVGVDVGAPWTALIVAVLALVVYSAVAGYRYAMAPYLLWKNPQMRAREALRESRKRMRGKKIALFLVHLSYIGWQILYAVAVVLLAVVWEALLGWLPGGTFLLWMLSLLCAGFLGIYMFAGGFAFFLEADARADADA